MTSPGVVQLGGEAPMETNPEKKHIVQDLTYLSESLLWTLLTNYYKNMALGAWSNNYVPMFVTSNSRFARSYAKTVFNFLKDWYKSPDADVDSPVYILEVGAGHGRFTFLFLRHLLRTQPFWKACGLPKKSFVYVLSDVAKANIEFCRQHHALQSFINDGWLDFAIFDANHTDNLNHSIDLFITGKPMPRNVPIVMISNYVLDSLLTDGIRICVQPHKDSLYSVFSRSQVSVHSPQHEPDPTDPDIISRMSLRWNWESFDFPEQDTTEPCCKDINETQPLHFLDPSTSDTDFYMGILSDKKKLSNVSTCLNNTPLSDTTSLASLKPHLKAPAYILNNPRIRAVLRLYAKQAQETPGFSTMSFVFPIGAIKLFDFLHHYSGQKLVAMIGDKGYKDWDEFRGIRNPHIAIHGSISFMVNLHAIKTYFEFMGGCTISTPYRDTFQITCCYAINAFTSDSLGETLSHFVEDLEDFPPDGLIAWQRYCQEGHHSNTTLSIKNLLYLLRYSAHDPDVFFNFRKEWASQATSTFLGPRGESDFQKDIERVFENWYKLRDHEDIPDLLAQLSMKTGRLDRAIFFFKKSILLCPESKHSATFVNMAACYKALGYIDQAHDAIEVALNQHPTFQPAIDLKNHLQMCGSKTSIAFIGCGKWTRTESLPTLLRDPRVECKAVFAFRLSVAEAIKKLIDDTNPTYTCTVYTGPKGLDDILHNKDIHACIVDVHGDVFSGIATKIWSAGKHILSCTPLALSSDTAQDIISRYYTIHKELKLNTLKQHVLGWHIAANPRFEDAFKTASTLIKERTLGRPISITFRFASDEGLAQTDLGIATTYDATELLAIHLLNGIIGISSIISGSLTTLSVAYGQPQFDKTIDLTDTTILSPSLVGWGRFLIDGLHELLASFFVSRHTTDMTNHYYIQCTAGVLILKQTGQSWKIITLPDTPHLKQQELGFVSDGLSTFHDLWLQHIYHLLQESQLETNSTYTTRDTSAEYLIDDQQEPSVCINSVPIQIPSIDSSVHSALADSAIVEAILGSIKRGGCAMQFDHQLNHNVGNKQQSCYPETTVQCHD